MVEWKSRYPCHVHDLHAMLMVRSRPVCYSLIYTKIDIVWCDCMTNINNRSWYVNYDMHVMYNMVCTLLAASHYTDSHNAWDLPGFLLYTCPKSLSFGWFCFPNLCWMHTPMKRYGVKPSVIMAISACARASTWVFSCLPVCKLACHCGSQEGEGLNFLFPNFFIARVYIYANIQTHARTLKNGGACTSRARYKTARLDDSEV